MGVLSSGMLRPYPRKSSRPPLPSNVRPLLNQSVCCHCLSRLGGICIVVYPSPIRQSLRLLYPSNRNCSYHQDRELDHLDWVLGFICPTEKTLDFLRLYCLPLLLLATVFPSGECPREVSSSRRSCCPVWFDLH